MVKLLLVAAAGLVAFALMLPVNERMAVVAFLVAVAAILLTRTPKRWRRK